MPARILWVGHSTVLVDMDGVRLLTDPLLRRRVVHLRRVDPVPPDAIPDIDAVLVSHLHFDHLDIPSLALLGRNLRLVVPRGAGALARRKRFTEVEELGVGDELHIGSLLVRGTPAVHDPRRLPGGARAEPLGFVIEGTRSVYFAGDTDVFDDMAALAPVDVALLPIWGWGPSLGPGHMGPREAVQASQLLRPTVVVPIHWGTYFPLQLARHGRPAFLDRPAEEFRAQMESDAPQVEVRLLRPGDETTV
jgi:L-ascorbate metabolism protein UlaG (beta-lactamase superfamily)